MGLGQESNWSCWLFEVVAYLYRRPPSPSAWVRAVNPADFLLSSRDWLFLSFARGFFMMMKSSQPDGRGVG